MNIDEGSLTAADGVSLSYHRLPAADARAVVVIVHGVGDHQGRYAALETALHAAGVTVYGYDQRGHGRSGGQRTDVRRFEDYVDDLERVRDFVHANEPNRPLFVFGHSMGSIVALMHALRHPHQWQGVIVAGCPLRPVHGGAPWLRPFTALLAWLGPATRLSARIDGTDLTHDAAIAETYRRDPLVGRSVTLRWAAQFLAATAALLPQTAGLTMPVLVLHGEADRVARVEGSRLLYERIGARDKSLCVYPGLYHELHNERPADAARVFVDIVDWLGAHAAATSAAA